MVHLVSGVCWLLSRMVRFPEIKTANYRKFFRFPNSHFPAQFGYRTLIASCRDAELLENAGKRGKILGLILLVFML